MDNQQPEAPKAEVTMFSTYCHCKPPKLDANDKCAKCGTQWSQ